MVASELSSSRSFINSQSRSQSRSQRTANSNSEKQLELRKENKQLYKVWFVGVNPQDFNRIMRVQEVQSLSIPLLCDDILRGLKNGTKQKKQPTASSFQELNYLVSGIILLYESQVTFLYDEVLRQAQSSLEFVQKNRAAISWEDARPAKSSKKNRSRKNSDPNSYTPKKRVRLNVDTTFNWKEDLNDVEVDDESTILMLQKSKVMNRDQIRLRDTAEEPTRDLYFQDDEFDAAENANTQNFLEIRDLVSRGRSIRNIIQNEGFNPLPTQDRMDMSIQENEWDVDQYQPITSQHDDEPYDPLADIETYQQELDVGTMPQNVEDDANNFKMPGIPSRFDAPELFDDNLLDNLSIITESTTKGTKRKRRRFMDYVTQIAICEPTDKNDKKIARCVSGRLDCVTDTDLLFFSRARLFDKPIHMSKGLKLRHFKDTKSLMIGVQRAKRLKRKEEDDLNIVDEFLNPTKDQPQQDEPVFDMIAPPPEPDVSILNTIVNRRKVNQRKSQHIEDVPFVNDHVFEHQDEPMYESEPEIQSNLPNATQTGPNELLQLSYIDPNECANTYRHKPMEIPATVLQLLNKFVTNTSDEPGSYGSQALFVMKNQQNRKNWGIKGVLSHLLGLWNSNIHPVGMKELMQTNKEKFAAALAFYSIMELNSPRIGLILIEKYPDSNIVFNIKQSPKLINLLQNM